jgi:hypothetical protein
MNKNWSAIELFHPGSRAWEREKSPLLVAHQFWIAATALLLAGANCALALPNSQNTMRQHDWRTSRFSFSYV